MKQRLQEQEAAVASEGSDMARTSAKVHALEYDLGNLRQSLQVSHRYLTTMCTAVPCAGILAMLLIDKHLCVIAAQQDGNCMMCKTLR